MQWALLASSVVQLICFTISFDLPNDTPVMETRGYMKREHSLVKPYQGSGMSVPYWDFVGSTIVSNQNVRLTSNTQSRNGGLWNSVPLKSRDWEVVITFAVHGTTGDLHGDGMAFWYVKERNALGPIFGSKDYFQGLAIFLDTYSNHNGAHNHAHPYISGMVNNGSLHYDHDRDGTHTQLGGSGKGCTVKFRNKDYETNILIRYVNDAISVYTDFDNMRTWKECFTVGGVRLPLGFHLGASAATGDLTDNHDIIAIKTYEIEVARSEKRDEVDRVHVIPYAQSVAAPRDHVDDPPPSNLGSFGTAFLFIFALGGIAAVVITGVVVFQKRIESSRKRFY